MTQIIYLKKEIQCLKYDLKQALMRGVDPLDLIIMTMKKLDNIESLAKPSYAVVKWE